MRRNHLPGLHFFTRITLLVLCALYLLFSVGVMKATHSCMGREASVTYFTSESKECACSLLSEENNHCCEDSHDLVKLDDSQKNLISFKLQYPAWILLGALYTQAPVATEIAPSRLRISEAVEPPPPKILFKIYCSFVFYDGASIA